MTKNYFFATPHEIKSAWWKTDQLAEVYLDGKTNTPRWFYLQGRVTRVPPGMQSASDIGLSATLPYVPDFMELKPRTETDEVPSPVQEFSQLGFESAAESQGDTQAAPQFVPHVAAVTESQPSEAVKAPVSRPRWQGWISWPPSSRATTGFERGSSAV